MVITDLYCGVSGRRTRVAGLVAVCPRTERVSQRPRQAVKKRAVCQPPDGPVPEPEFPELDLKPLDLTEPSLLLWREWLPSQSSGQPREEHSGRPCCPQQHCPAAKAHAGLALGQTPAPPRPAPSRGSRLLSPKSSTPLAAGEQGRGGQEAPEGQGGLRRRQTEDAEADLPGGGSTGQRGPGLPSQQLDRLKEPEDGCASVRQQDHG